jgi:hypothetical protein
MEANRRTHRRPVPGSRTYPRTALRPGDPKHGKAGFYPYAHPAPAGFADGTLSTAAAQWNAELGEYLLDWDDVRASEDPHSLALEFARSAFQHACLVCGWDEKLAASAEGAPPPIS